MPRAGALALAAALVWVACDPPIEERPPPAARGTFVPGDGPNQPVGRGVGVHPGRVAWVHDPAATPWDGEGRPWDHVDAAVVDRMMADAVLWLAGADTPEQAWRALFVAFQTRLGRPAVGYAEGETIAIKINANTDGSERGDTSPFAARALLRQLTGPAGVPPEAITVYDASKEIGDAWLDACVGDDATLARVRFGVRVVTGLSRKRGRAPMEPDPAVVVHFADPAIPHTPPTQLPAAVTAASYLMNLASLKQNSLSGVSLCAKNWFGSVYRAGGCHDGWCPAHLHDGIATVAHGGGAGRGYGRYNPLVELMGHPQLGGKTMLYGIDGLLAGRTHEDGLPERWSSAPFDGGWSASLLLSQDPVAVESVAIDVMLAENRASAMPWLSGAVDDYLHEAARADAPPSGTRYDPDGDGALLASLGTHEHWSDDVTRSYSRNLGRDAGIELVSGAPLVARLSVETVPVLKGLPAYRLVARTSDDARVERVEFWSGETLLGTDAGAPFEHHLTIPLEQREANAYPVAEPVWARAHYRMPLNPAVADSPPVIPPAAGVVVPAVPGSVG